MTNQELLDRLGVDALIADDGRKVRRRRTPHELVGLRVDEISAVDRPANRRRFLVVKQDDEAGAEALEHEAETFDDMIARRRIGHVVSALSDYYGALIETLTSIANSDEGGKPTLVRAAIDDYLGSLTGALDDVIADAFSKE